MRDNFTPKTKEMLGKAVGYNCVRPGCARPTIAIDESRTSLVYIGAASHDSAASPDGPRYDENLTAQQRKALENGAHLCASCARLVDADPTRFPPGVISQWQVQAEDSRRELSSNPHGSSGLNFKDACIAARKFLRECDEVRLERWGKYISWKSFSAMEKLVRISYPMNIFNEFCTMYPHMVNIQTEIINTIMSIVNEIKNSGCWFYDEYLQGYSLYPKKTYPVDDEFNSRIERSFEIVQHRAEDFYNLCRDLRKISNMSSPTMNLLEW